jgi:chromosomal replication initiator protein
LGKTHLLHAIGNLLSESRLQVLYVSGEEFANDFITSVRTHKMTAFREKHRNVDVLLFDEFDFIVDKEKTVEEFLHTIKELLPEKQIVIAANKAPDRLSGLDRALASRLKEGMVFEITPPDADTCIKILQEECIASGYALDEDTLEIIVQLTGGDVRVMKGSLQNVDFARIHANLPLTYEAIAKLLAYHVHTKEISIEDILLCVSEEYGVSVEELVARNNARRVSIPRQVVMYLAREHDFSLVETGKALGGRDHTTIRFGANAILDNLIKDLDLKDHIQNIQRKLSPHLVFAT